MSTRHLSTFLGPANCKRADHVCVCVCLFGNREWMVAEWQNHLEVTCSIQFILLIFKNGNVTPTADRAFNAKKEEETKQKETKQ